MIKLTVLTCRNIMPLNKLLNAECFPGGPGLSELGLGERTDAGGVGETQEKVTHTPLYYTQLLKPNLNTVLSQTQLSVSTTSH